MNKYYNTTNFDNFNSSNQFIIKFIGFSLTYCATLLVISTIVILKIKKRNTKFYMIINKQV